MGERPNAKSKWMKIMIEGIDGFGRPRRSYWGRTKEWNSPKTTHSFTLSHYLVRTTERFPPPINRSQWKIFGRFKKLTMCAGIDGNEIGFFEMDGIGMLGGGNEWINPFPIKNDAIHIFTNLGYPMPTVPEIPNSSMKYDQKQVTKAQIMTLLIH